MKNDIYAKHSRKQGGEQSGKKAAPPTVNVWEHSLRRQRIQNGISIFLILLIAGLIMFIAFQQQSGIAEPDSDGVLIAPPPLPRQETEVATTRIRPLAPLPGDDARSGLMLDLLRRSEPFHVGAGDHSLSADAVRAVAWHLLQAEQNRQQGELSEALQEYETALRIFPRLQGVYGAVGMIHMEMGDAAAALQAFDQAVRLEGASAGLMNNQAIAAMQLNQYERAIALFQEAIGLQPDYAPAHYNLAIAYSRQGEHALASRQFREYLRLSPRDLDSILSFSALLIEVGQWQGAAGLLALADREAPGTPSILFRLAEARAQSGQLNEAMNALERALERVDARQALRWIGRREFDPLRDHPDFQRLLDQLGG